MDTDKKDITNLPAKKHDLSTLFDDDLDFAFTYKKTEKLVSAVYLVTNLFSDSEPIKWTLRRKSSELLSYILGYKDIQNSSASDFAFVVKTKVMEIVSLLEISSVSGLLSPMNFSILKTEFSNLLDVFQKDRFNKKETNSGVIPKDFFGEHRAPNAGIKGHSDVVRVVSTINNLPTISGGSSSLERDIAKRSNRQNIIINLLKKRKELTIKDIALIIKDCSEKTIQRELISLIVSGVIKREGERRWSKYSLVSSS